jgi:hypothetical protein
MNHFRSRILSTSYDRATTSLNPVALLRVSAAGKGSISLAQYWIVTTACLVAFFATQVALFALDRLVLRSDGAFTSPISLLAFVLLAIIIWRASIMRMRDLNYPEGPQRRASMPFFPILVSFELFLRPGNAGR